MRKEKGEISQKNIEAETTREKYVEELIDSVTHDFEERRKERLFYERQWELNMNFLRGNQYCYLNGRGEIYDDSKTFYWQNRSVFNHIAPIIDSRLSKFSLVTPTISVRPKTDDDIDVASANLADKLIENAMKDTSLNEVVKKVTNWSETCGTGFYKVLWDNDGGNNIGESNGKSVYEGQVKVIAVSPFEIFPDSLNNENISDCESIIHARAMTAEAVKEKYNVSLIGEDIDVESLTRVTGVGRDDDNKSVLKNAVIVMEKYVKPSEMYPDGRLITVAGGKLLYYGELPYKNGKNGAREFPFVKQVSMYVAGSFFGASIIERLIPVQRAFNAVKNRKHEFLNRLSMGVMTVEDGSLDVDDLRDEGLSPGKVLVYRQGAKSPEIMPDNQMPSDFNEEENKLINEFVIISGVSDVMSSSNGLGVTSATALEILVEQDNSRLCMTAEIIRQCYLEIARHIIRLYSQFSVGVRAIKYQDDYNRTRIYYADKDTVNSDDVYLVSENELLYTQRQKKDMIFELYESGLLQDENGRVSAVTKEKVLTLLGYKELDSHKGISRLQEDKAQRENDLLKKQNVNVDEIDDDLIHIDEHTRYFLSEYMEMNEQVKSRYFQHIKAHKEKLKKEKESLSIMPKTTQTENKSIKEQENKQKEENPQNKSIVENKNIQTETEKLKKIIKEEK